MEGGAGEGGEGAGWLRSWSGGRAELAAEESHGGAVGDGRGGGGGQPSNYHTLKWLNRHNSLTVLEVRGTRIKVSVGLCPFWRLQGRICLLLLASPGGLYPLARGPSSIFKTHHVPNSSSIVASFLFFLQL